MIEKIRQYFIDNEILDNESRINVDFLGNEPTEFAIEPTPVDPIITKFVNGSSLRQFQFILYSCNAYSSDVLQNMSNSSFYEQLYNKIESLNDEDKLPNIDGIETIECLDNGSIKEAGTNVARYSIQMRITYFKE